MGALGEPDGDLLGLSVGVPCSGGSTGCCASRLRRRAILGWVCHIGATRMISPLSDTTLFGINGIKLKGRKAYPARFFQYKLKTSEWRTAAGLQLLRVGRQMSCKPIGKEVPDAVCQERSDNFRIYNPVCLASKFETLGALKYSVFAVHDVLLCTDRSECTNSKVEVLDLRVLKSVFSLCD